MSIGKIANARVVVFQFLQQQDIAKCLSVCRVWNHQVAENAFQIYNAQKSLWGGVQLCLDDDYEFIQCIRGVYGQDAFVTVNVWFPLKIFRDLFWTTRCHMPLHVFYKKVRLTPQQCVDGESDTIPKKTGEKIKVVSESGKRFVFYCLNSRGRQTDEVEVSFNKALEGRIENSQLGSYLSDEEVRQSKQKASEETRDFIPITHFPEPTAQPKLKADQ